MNVELYNDNELRIRFSDKNDDEVIAIAKAMRILEDVIAKETQASKERLLAAIENSGDSYAKMKEFEYALELYKTNNQNCLEIKNLIEVLSKAD